MPRSCRWTPLGPIGVVKPDSPPGKMVMSGRVTALAVHPGDPDVVYAGTAGGGVWRTVDHGCTWKALFDRGPSLAVGALAIDPSYPARVLVGTGEGNDTRMAFEGVGVLLTENAGETWRRIDLPCGRTTQIVISPTGDRIYVASQKGLFEWRKAADPGGTYAPTLWTVVSTEWISDVVYDAVGDRLYAGIQGKGVFVREGSQPLSAVPTPADPAKALPSDVDGRARIALAWIVSDRRTLLTVFTHESKDGRKIQGIFRYDGNAGWEWQTLYPPDNPHFKDKLSEETQAYYTLAFARNPNHPTDVYLGLVGLWRSTDLGDTFEPYSPPPPPKNGEETGEERRLRDIHSDQHVLAFPTSGEDIWLGNDGGVWLSTDRAQTWSHRNRGLAAIQFYAGAQHDGVASLVLGGTQDNDAEFHDGQPLWRASVEGDVQDVAIDSGNRRAWISTNYGEVKRSNALDERDTSFEDLPGEGSVVPVDKSQHAQFFSRLALAPSNPNRAYRGFGLAIPLKDPTSEEGEAETSGELFRIDMDKEAAWLPIPEYPAQGGKTVSALTVDPNDADVVYVADKHGVVFRVHYATPTSTVTRMPPIEPAVLRVPVGDLVVSRSDPDRIYVSISEDLGTDRILRGRLYRWDKTVGHWIDLTGGIPGPVVDGLTVDPRSNAIHAIVIDPAPSDDPGSERLFIGCDRGVFESRDGGDNWRPIDDGLPYSPVFDLAFHARKRLLRAFTHGRGAWERNADLAPCSGLPPSPEVDLVLRDQRYDDGGVTEPDTLDPVRRDRGFFLDKETRVHLRWTDAPDVKVDREPMAGETSNDEQGDPVDLPAGFQHASSVDYTADGALDSIGFEALEHRAPRLVAPGRIHVQVHNRGPDAAHHVTVRLFWAKPNGDGSWPDLAPDFWTSFPSSNPSPPWQPFGAAKTIPEIRPAEPEVLTWSWNFSALMPESIGILAVTTCPDDPVFEGTAPGAMERHVETLVRGNKRVTLKLTKTTRVVPSALARTIDTIAKYAAFGFLVGVGGVLLYEAIDKG